MRKLLIAIALSFTALAASAVPTPASARYYAQDACDNCGTVRYVEQRSHHDRHLGGGTLLGAVVGGALGNTIGKGDGRKAATIGGAVVGGAVGHSVEKRHRHEHISYWIEVHMDHGRILSFEQRDGFGLRPGDRVVVEDGYVHPYYR